ncbi:XRE family transcriptional regulator [Actinoplanes sp. SE50]|uniref:helix-turn-helix transcriptional regulator n=1 Tax=unclassified Actinoplanes TaxID=2626549 RepID=UPI00023EC2C1|nr:MULTISPECIES: helix-turn-helix transcriptional regulator [unclassified Actinoplanes]AEV85213.1 transcriptional regulator, XRE family [Actinoplanes sp. SE50/110]ATO83608.1 XRE family transcriptional regulator [Actinoplanes sp. SE50]SLM01016.1 transcriptional regulator [Actinoplanes sp. SE50/110]
MLIDRAGLAEFLRRRRESLQPEDVGLPRGTRRRTAGLRREEVATLCHLSADYYSRLERGRGPHPSPQMVASIAQGLHLSLDERDHLFRLAGHHPPVRGDAGDHISPGLLRIFDRLTDTPAEIITELGETLRQNALGVALNGDLTRFTGPARSIGWRWFTDPASRARYHPDDHRLHSRVFASGLRQVATLRGPGSRAAQLQQQLLDGCAEFREVWNEHEIGIRYQHVKRFVHPEVGGLELTCQALLDPEQGHSLLVYTAVPGSDSHQKLALLSVIGTQDLTVDT